MWNKGTVGYHQFIDPETGEKHGSFEVFEHAPSVPFPGDEEPFEHGFYWRACFPGCMPDGDASGPFKTAHEAYTNAQDNCDDDAFNWTDYSMRQGEMGNPDRQR